MCVKTRERESERARVRERARVLFSPGPFAPPRKIRPRRNIMARSYSLTICKQNKNSEKKIQLPEQVSLSLDILLIQWWIRYAVMCNK